MVTRGTRLKDEKHLGLTSPDSWLAPKAWKHWDQQQWTSHQVLMPSAECFQKANAPVLLLFDEVLNFLNRHRNMAEPFYAFLQNLTVAVTGANRTVAVISLPRSQVEMTEWDQEWQERITKVVKPGSPRPHRQR